MFTIDLLKGKGVPVQLKPAMIAIGSIPFVVPVLAAVVLVCFYGGTFMRIASARSEIAPLDKKILEHLPEVKFARKINTGISNTNKDLNEVAVAIKQFCQFSGILETLSEELPDSILFKEIKITGVKKKMKLPDPKDSSKKIERRFMKRIMRIDVCGIPSRRTDVAVREYIKWLQEPKALGSLIERIGIVSEEDGKLNEKAVTLYGIECRFKIRT